MPVIEKAIEEGDGDRLHALALEGVERPVNIRSNQRGMLAAVLIDSAADA